MRAERDKETAKITAEELRLTDGKLEWEADGETCRVVLLSGGSCSVQWGEELTLENPGCALLLGPGKGWIEPVGRTTPELLLCRFPLDLLHEVRTTAQQDYTHLFEPGQRLELYGAVPWFGQMRTLLELMRRAAGEPDYPGVLYLLLVLHYAEQEYRAESAVSARPRNETVSQICAYLSANYQQKLSLTEVAARFYLSPYYLSRLFRRVTGQSIVDYINGRRIEAAQRLLETTDLSISDVAEQTGFTSAAHFRRVFHETMGVRPLQYRKEHR